MFTLCFDRWRALVAAGLCALAAAVAAEPVLEPFDAGTWRREFAAPAQPAVVVFTTTDCTHCPRVVTGLADALRQHRAAGKLVVVVMDGLAPDELAQHPHYRRAGRLLVFDGQEAALRHGVNPSWRGVTPYVAFLLPGQAPGFVVGPPDAGRVEAWMAASRSTFISRSENRP